MGWPMKVRGMAVAVGAALALGAAAQPSALAQAAGGLWEVTGAPGTAQPVRQCIRDTRALAQFEHRRQACPRTIISDAGTTAVIQYNCAAQGFGSSRITVITPRSLRIQTQGISDGLPFNYVIQARRVGNCSVH